MDPGDLTQQSVKCLYSLNHLARDILSKKITRSSVNAMVMAPCCPLCLTGPGPCCPVNIFTNGAGELAKLLRALALANDLGLICSIHMPPQACTQYTDIIHTTPTHTSCSFRPHRVPRAKPKDSIPAASQQCGMQPTSASVSYPAIPLTKAAHMPDNTDQKTDPFPIFVLSFVYKFQEPQCPLSYIWSASALERPRGL